MLGCPPGWLADWLSVDWGCLVGVLVPVLERVLWSGWVAAGGCLFVVLADLGGAWGVWYLWRGGLGGLELSGVGGCCGGGWLVLDLNCWMWGWPVWLSLSGGCHGGLLMVGAGGALRFVELAVGLVGGLTGDGCGDVDAGWLTARAEVLRTRVVWGVLGAADSGLVAVVLCGLLLVAGRRWGMLWVVRVAAGWLLVWPSVLICYALPAGGALLGWLWGLGLEGACVVLAELAGDYLDQDLGGLGCGWLLGRSWWGCVFCCWECGVPAGYLLNWSGDAWSCLISVGLRGWLLCWVWESGGCGLCAAALLGDGGVRQLAGTGGVAGLAGVDAVGPGAERRLIGWPVINVGISFWGVLSCGWAGLLLGLGMVWGLLGQFGWGCGESCNLVHVKLRVAAGSLYWLWCADVLGCVCAGERGLLVSDAVGKLAGGGVVGAGECELTELMWWVVVVLVLGSLFSCAVASSRLLNGLCVRSWGDESWGGDAMPGGTDTETLGGLGWVGWGWLGAVAGCLLILSGSVALLGVGTLGAVWLTWWLGGSAGVPVAAGGVLLVAVAGRGPGSLLGWGWLRDWGDGGLAGPAGGIELLVLLTGSVVAVWSGGWKLRVGGALHRLDWLGKVYCGLLLWALALVGCSWWPGWGAECGAAAGGWAAWSGAEWMEKGVSVLWVGMGLCGMLGIVAGVVWMLDCWVCAVELAVSCGTGCLGTGARWAWDSCCWRAGWCLEMGLTVGEGAGLDDSLAGLTGCCCAELGGVCGAARGRGLGAGIWICWSYVGCAEWAACVTGAEGLDALAAHWLQRAGGWTECGGGGEGGLGGAGLGWTGSELWGGGWLAVGWFGWNAGGLDHAGLGRDMDGGAEGVGGLLVEPGLSAVCCAFWRGFGGTVCLLVGVGGGAGLAALGCVAAEGLGGCGGRTAFLGTTGWRLVGCMVAGRRSGLCVAELEGGLGGAGDCGGGGVCGRGGELLSVGGGAGLEFGERLEVWVWGWGEVATGWLAGWGGVGGMVAGWVAGCGEGEVSEWLRDGDELCCGDWVGWGGLAVGVLSWRVLLVGGWAMGVRGVGWGLGLGRGGGGRGWVLGESLPGTVKLGGGLSGYGLTVEFRAGGNCFGVAACLKTDAGVLAWHVMRADRVTGRWAGSCVLTTVVDVDRGTADCLRMAGWAGDLGMMQCCRGLLTGWALWLEGGSVGAVEAAWGLCLLGMSWLDCRALLLLSGGLGEVSPAMAAMSVDACGGERFWGCSGRALGRAADLDVWSAWTGGCAGRDWNWKRLGCMAGCCWLGRLCGLLDCDMGVCVWPVFVGYGRGAFHAEEMLGPGLGVWLLAAELACVGRGLLGWAELVAVLGHGLVCLFVGAVGSGSVVGVTTDGDWYGNVLLSSVSGGRWELLVAAEMAADWAVLGSVIPCRLRGWAEAAWAVWSCGVLTADRAGGCLRVCLLKLVERKGVLSVVWAWLSDGDWSWGAGGPVAGPAVWLVLGGGGAGYRGGCLKGRLAAGVGMCLVSCRPGWADAGWLLCWLYADPGIHLICCWECGRGVAFWLVADWAGRLVWAAGSGVLGWIVEYLLCAVAELVREGLLGAVGWRQGGGGGWGLEGWTGWGVDEESGRELSCWSVGCLVLVAEVGGCGCDWGGGTVLDGEGSVLHLSARGADCLWVPLAVCGCGTGLGGASAYAVLEMLDVVTLNTGVTAYLGWGSGMFTCGVGWSAVRSAECLNLFREGGNWLTGWGLAGAVWVLLLLAVLGWVLGVGLGGLAGCLWGAGCLCELVLWWLSCAWLGWGAADGRGGLTGSWVQRELDWGGLSELGGGLAEERRLLRGGDCGLLMWLTWRWWRLGLAGSCGGAGIEEAGWAVLAGGSGRQSAGRRGWMGNCWLVAVVLAETFTERGAVLVALWLRTWWAVELAAADGGAAWAGRLVFGWDLVIGAVVIAGCGVLWHWGAGMCLAVGGVWRDCSLWCWAEELVLREDVSARIVEGRAEGLRGLRDWLLAVGRGLAVEGGAGLACGKGVIVSTGLCVESGLVAGELWVGWWAGALVLGGGAGGGWGRYYLGLSVWVAEGLGGREAGGRRAGGLGCVVGAGRGSGVGVVLMGGGGVGDVGGCVVGVGGSLAARWVGLGGELGCDRCCEWACWIAVESWLNWGGCGGSAECAVGLLAGGWGLGSPFWGFVGLFLRQASAELELLWFVQVMRGWGRWAGHSVVWGVWGDSGSGGAECFVGELVVRCSHTPFFGCRWGFFRGSGAGVGKKLWLGCAWGRWVWGGCWGLGLTDVAIESCLVAVGGLLDWMLGWVSEMTGLGAVGWAGGGLDGAVGRAVGFGVCGELGEAGCGLEGAGVLVARSCWLAGEGAGCGCAGDRLLLLVLAELGSSAVIWGSSWEVDLADASGGRPGSGCGLGDGGGLLIRAVGLGVRVGCWCGNEMWAGCGWIGLKLRVGGSEAVAVWFGCWPAGMGGVGIWGMSVGVEELLGLVLGCWGLEGADCGWGGGWWAGGCRSGVGGLSCEAWVAGQWIWDGVISWQLGCTLVGAWWCWLSVWKGFQELESWGMAGAECWAVVLVGAGLASGGVLWLELGWCELGAVRWALPGLWGGAESEAGGSIWELTGGTGGCDWVGGTAGKGVMLGGGLEGDVGLDVAELGCGLWGGAVCGCGGLAWGGLWCVCGWEGWRLVLCELDWAGRGAAAGGWRLCSGAVWMCGLAVVGEAGWGCVYVVCWKAGVGGGWGSGGVCWPIGAAAKWDWVVGLGAEAVGLLWDRDWGLAEAGGGTGAVCMVGGGGFWKSGVMCGAGSVGMLWAGGGGGGGHAGKLSDGWMLSPVGVFWVTAGLWGWAEGERVIAGVGPDALETLGIGWVGLGDWRAVEVGEAEAVGDGADWGSGWAGRLAGFWVVLEICWVGGLRLLLLRALVVEELSGDWGWKRYGKMGHGSDGNREEGCWALAVLAGSHLSWRCHQCCVEAVCCSGLLDWKRVDWCNDAGMAVKLWDDWADEGRLCAVGRLGSADCLPGWDGVIGGLWRGLGLGWSSWALVVVLAWVLAGAEAAAGKGWVVSVVVDAGGGLRAVWLMVGLLTEDMCDGLACPGLSGVAGGDDCWDGCLVGGVTGVWFWLGVAVGRLKSGLATEAVLDRIDSDVNPQVPLILERPFLRMARALIDVYREKLTLRVDDEAITFKVGQTSRYSCSYKTVNQVNVIDVACEEYAQEVLEFLDSSSSGNPTPSDPIIASSSPSFTHFE
ncbi:hypothetical protein Tco_0909603 [Tanacetum coccineum]|uniref:Uncharacterized protein n=1 Tax=Tanacetum coccineum TaxID=301880 RepID=A0ABQ5CSM7_9ASTR